MKKCKGNEGVALVSLTVTVIILIILSGMLIYNARTGIVIQKLKNMQNDIDLLSNEISAYYMKYGDIPAEIEYQGEINFERQPNDDEIYYVIDLSAFEDITLNYGLEFKNIASSEDTLTYSDYYIINKQSHHVYYPKGIEMDGIMYYTNGTDEEVTLIEKKAIVPGKKYDEDTEITIGEEKITIPKGTTVSGIEGEYEKIEDGIVIYVIPEGEEVEDWNADTDGNEIKDVQEKYDQFVWVPVPNAVLDLSSTFSTLDETGIKAAVQSEINAGRYPMAIKKDDTNYLGVLYQYTEENGAVKVEPDSSWTPLCETNTYYREPSAVTSYDNSTYLPQVNGILNTSYSDSTSFSNALQVEFNTMVNKVANKKGFWVGRYETSNMSNSTTETYASSNEIKVNVVKGTTTGISSVTWYRMYAQQKLYSSKANITLTSSMIWGSQWNQIMIWMREEPNTKNITNGQYYVINAVGMGNYGVDETRATKSTKALETTGNSENYKVKNVYDLAGNVYDWTLEANYTVIRVLRGGGYTLTDSSNARADGRNLSFPNGSGAYFGSRSTLY